MIVYIEIYEDYLGIKAGSTKINPTEFGKLCVQALKQILSFSIQMENLRTCLV